MVVKRDQFDWKIRTNATAFKDPPKLTGGESQEPQVLEILLQWFGQAATTARDVLLPEAPQDGESAPRVRQSGPANPGESVACPHHGLGSRRPVAEKSGPVGCVLRAGARSPQIWRSRNA